MVKWFSSQNTYSTQETITWLPIFFSSYLVRSPSANWSFAHRTLSTLLPKDLFCTYLRSLTSHSILHWLATILFFTWYPLLHQTIVNQTRKGLGKWGKLFFTKLRLAYYTWILVHSHNMKTNSSLRRPNHSKNTPPSQKN